MQLCCTMVDTIKPAVHHDELWCMGCTVVVNIIPFPYDDRFTVEQRCEKQ